MEKIATPFTFDSVHGSVISVDERMEIMTSVKTILKTSIHERTTLTNFGSRLQDYVFTMMEYTNLEMIKKEVTLTLYEQEPRIQGIQVRFQRNQEREGILFIYISYQIVKTYACDTITLQAHPEGIIV